MSMPRRSSSSGGEVRVLDASVVINLNATDCATDILLALGGRTVVVDTVIDELKLGSETSRNDAAKVEDLVGAGALELVALGEAGYTHFAALVTGRASETLDDGEAATIAVALEHRGAIVVLDERKANRICRERHPELPSMSTVDLFLHPAVGARLGRARLANAVLRALLHARMQVPARHLAWVVELVGAEQAAHCSSLPRSIRQPQAQT